MASVWRHPKTPNWFARYRGAKGKTINRSTGITDREEAKRIAQQWEIEAAREREKQPRGEVSPGGISDTVARAERLARQGRLDPASAREIINSLLVAAGNDRLDAVTNRLWCDGWKAGKKGAVKESSRLKYDQVCRVWLTFLNGKADKPLEIIGKTEALSFRDKLASTGLAPRTVNHTVKLLRGVYGEAVEQGHIGRNPFVGVQALREETGTSKRKPFTREDVAALLKAATGDWKGLILLAATTGLRLMDAAQLQWRTLDLDERVIRIKTSKTSAALTLPIHHEFASWLAEQPRGIGAAPVFPSLASKGGTGKSGLSMAFKRLMGRANIAPGIAREGKDKGRATSQKSFHSLRHFAATQLASNGVRAEVARQITGHADEESHAHYINADMNALRRAVKNIKLA